MGYAGSSVLWLDSLVGQAVFSNGQAISYFPCPGIVGELISKGSKALFVILIQADLLPKFPGRMMLLAFLCR